VRFRAETTINTLTILGPCGHEGDLAEPRGPDSNYVRVLVPGGRERRQIRRRMRGFNRLAHGGAKRRVHQVLMHTMPSRFRRSSPRRAD